MTKLLSKKALYSTTAGKTLAVIASFALITGCETVTNNDVASTAKTVMQAMTSDAHVLPATTSNDAARALYMAGWADLDNARGVTANTKFKEAAAADPSFAMAHVMSAWTAASTEGFVSSVGKASANADGASKGEKLLVNMVESFLENDAAGATAATKALTEVHPKSPRAWNFYGNALATTTDTEAARAAFKMATKLDASYVPGFTNLGNDYLTQEPKNFAKAEMLFKKAIALTPNEPNPHDLLGDVHRAQNNLKAAYKDYTKAAELAPDLGSGLQQRGHVNSFLGNYDEARADYYRAADLEDARGSTAGPNFRTYGAFVSLHEGKHDAAMAELQSISDNLEGSSMDGAADTRIGTLYTIARIAIEDGNAAAASKAISAATALETQQADAVGSDDIRSAGKATQLYFAGMLAARTGDSDGAAAAASAFKKQVADQTNPRKNERMHEVLGMNAYAQGDFAGAAEHLAKGNHVANMYTKYYLARAHEQAGNADEAAKLYGEMAVYNFNGPGYAMYRKDIVKRAAVN
jgi:tetratricopeptide (TPR) repeat protein